MFFRGQYRDHALTVRLQLAQVKNSLRAGASTGGNFGSLEHLGQCEESQTLRGPMAAWLDEQICGSPPFLTVSHLVAP